ncbi:MG2 domain-containing protein [Nitrososphaera sp.]|uniref:MG2 domain-containing protein n=1 Tax=Nitrososphaera sp. TaxID=1971748 RepID=UPI0031795201
MNNGDKARHVPKAAVALPVIAALLAATAFLPALQTAAAQSSGSASATGQIQTMYSTSYPKVQADADSSFTVQSEYHLYKPGDTVRIEGSMSSEMREETQSDTVSVNVKNASGQVVATQNATVDSSGNYSATITLPAGAQEGEYSADSKIEVSASVLGLLSADVIAKLEASAEFVVGSSASFDVEASGGEQFSVDITSNSNVSEVTLNEEAKRLSFTVEGQTGTTGAAEVTIPKAMLSGEMTVLIDGQLVTAESNDVILKSQTQTDATFEINYHHSEHTVEVTGTTVVPEFPLAALIMAAGVASVVGIVAVGRATGRFGLWS